MKMELHFGIFNKFLFLRGGIKINIYNFCFKCKLFKVKGQHCLNCLRHTLFQELETPEKFKAKKEQGKRLILRNL